MSKLINKLILASTSSYRAQMLIKCGLTFEQIDPRFDETELDDELPDRAAIRLAQGKADAVANRLKVEAPTESSEEQAMVIIGCDQIASLQGRKLGKPGTGDRAIEQLTNCSGKWVSFYTGLHLIHFPGVQSNLGKNTCEAQSYLEEFSVKFRTLSRIEITNYVEMDQPLDCAGSFKAEGLGLTLFDDMKGRDINTLYGLPMLALLKYLRNYGINTLL